MLKRTIISFPIEFDSVANGNYDVKLVPGHCIAGSSKAIGKLRKHSLDVNLKLPRSKVSYGTKLFFGLHVTFKVAVAVAVVVVVVKSEPL